MRCCAGRRATVLCRAVPRRGGYLSEQAEDVLQTLRPLSRRRRLGSIVMQVGLSAATSAIRPLAGGSSRSSTGRNCRRPPILPNRRAKEASLSIEAWGIGATDSRGRNRADRRATGCRPARRHAVGPTLRASAPRPATGPVYERSLRAFRLAGERLGGAGLRFDNVIRTWLYLGDITGMEGKTSRYYELNRARTEFYRDRSSASA